MPSRTPGHEVLELPFPEGKDWLVSGQPRDLGPFHEGMCSGHLYKTPDDTLYLNMHIMTWPEDVTHHLPLYVPIQRPSILDIRWGEEGVTLQQDDQPAIAIPWQTPRPTPTV